MMLTRRAYLATGALLLGVVIVADAAAPARRTPTKPKGVPQIIAPAEAAQPRPQDPTGGADLRANNPFALPEPQRAPYSTSGN